MSLEWGLVGTKIECREWDANRHVTPRPKPEIGHQCGGQAGLGSEHTVRKSGAFLPRKERRQEGGNDFCPQEHKNCLKTDVGGNDRPRFRRKSETEGLGGLDGPGGGLIEKP